MIREAPGSRSRKIAHRRGRRAEGLARLYLRLLGYRILAQNYRLPVGEIDLIACRRRHLLFIEVKHRLLAEDALSALLPRQQARIIRAAEGFLVHHPRYRNDNMEFALLLILPWRWPRMVRNAWQQDI